MPRRSFIAMRTSAADMVHDLRRPFPRRAFMAKRRASSGFRSSVVIGSRLPSVAPNGTRPRGVQRSEEPGEEFWSSSSQGTAGDRSSSLREAGFLLVAMRSRSMVTLSPGRGPRCSGFVRRKVTVRRRFGLRTARVRAASEFPSRYNQVRQAHRGRRARPLRRPSRSSARGGPPAAATRSPNKVSMSTMPQQERSRRRSTSVDLLASAGPWSPRLRQGHSPSGRRNVLVSPVDGPAASARWPRRSGGVRRMLVPCGVTAVTIAVEAGRPHEPGRAQQPGRDASRRAS